MTGLLYQWKALKVVHGSVSVLIKVLIFIPVFISLSPNNIHIYTCDSQNDLLYFEHVQKAEQ